MIRERLDDMERDALLGQERQGQVATDHAQARQDPIERGDQR